MKKLAASLIASALMLPVIADIPAVYPDMAASTVCAVDAAFDEEAFFVSVGTFSGEAQLRYIFRRSDGSYGAEKVVWKDAPENIPYGTVFVPTGELSMTSVKADHDNPVYAQAYYYELAEGTSLEEVGNCADIMESRDLTVTSVNYDGSAHWSVRCTDDDNNEYYYGLSTYGSSLGFDLTRCEPGDVVNFAVLNDALVIPMGKKVIPLIPFVMGDVNGDQVRSVADLVALQRWLIGTPDSYLLCWQVADMNKDGKVNVFDLCELRESITVSKTRPMTVDDIIELSKKGDALISSDFAPFTGEDVGSGLNIMRYEIENKPGLCLLVGYDGITNKPLYVKIVDETSAEERSVDIRSEEFSQALEWFNAAKNANDSEENRKSARKLGKYALEKLADGTFTTDTVITRSNASKLMDEELAAIMNSRIFTSVEFIDQHTVIMELSPLLFGVKGYIVTDGTIVFETDSQVSMPGRGYDGDVINIGWSEGDVCYFESGT